MTALAAGRVELYFEMSLAPWDHAASRVIIEEAGGCVANVYEDEISYTGQTSFIAANTPENLEKLRSIILEAASVRPEEEYVRQSGLRRRKVRGAAGKFGGQYESYFIETDHVWRYAQG